MDVPRILDAISSPADLKVLDNEELAILAREIRQEIVATTSVTGGHVASSLGAVDIIVALESLLDMPRDRVVFDVGHQAYAHKLLTGRREAFKTLRTYGGLSGFTKHRRALTTRTRRVTRPTRFPSPRVSRRRVS